MANPQHVEWLREGVAAWNQRRRRSPFTPDLSSEDLTRVLGGNEREDIRKISVRLPKVNLMLANLRNATLRDTDLRAAHLSKADFTNANLVGSNFSGASGRHKPTECQTVFYQVYGSTILLR